MRCGRTGTAAMLPSGPICSRCRRDIAYHPSVCPECFELRPIAYPSTSIYGTLVCAECAGEESVFACTRCGREDHPYGAKHCARCILTDRLTELLTDPAPPCLR
jgi:RecJ-like exonuclease